MSESIIPPIGQKQDDRPMLAPISLTLPGTASTIDDKMVFEVQRLAHEMLPRCCGDLVSAIRPRDSGEWDAIVLLDRSIRDGLDLYSATFDQLEQIEASFRSIEKAAKEVLAKLTKASDSVVVEGEAQDAVGPLPFPGIQSALNLLGVVAQENQHFGRTVTISEEALLFALTDALRETKISTGTAPSADSAPSPPANNTPATNTQSPSATNTPATNTPSPSATNTPATNTPSPSANLNVYHPALFAPWREERGGEVAGARAKLREAFDKAIQTKGAAYLEVSRLQMEAARRKPDDSQFHEIQFAAERAAGAFDNSDILLRELNSRLGTKEQGTGWTGYQALMRAASVMGIFAKHKGRCRLLYARVEAAGGSYRIRKGLAHLLGNDDGVGYRAGVVLSFGLFNLDGTMEKSGVLTKESDYESVAGGVSVPWKWLAALLAVVFVIPEIIRTIGQFAKR
jgi:hypothetical protein